MNGIVQKVILFILNYHHLVMPYIVGFSPFQIPELTLTPCGWAGYCDRWTYEDQRRENTFNQDNSVWLYKIISVQNKVQQI